MFAFFNAAQTMGYTSKHRLVSLNSIHCKKIPAKIKTKKAYSERSNFRQNVDMINFRHNTFHTACISSISRLSISRGNWGLVHKALLDVFSHANLSQTCLSQNEVCGKPS